MELQIEIRWNIMEAAEGELGLVIIICLFLSSNCDSGYDFIL